MNALKLAPSIAMINVVGIDIELHFTVQVIPSTNSPAGHPPQSLTQPYEIRRNFEDFVNFDKKFREKLSKEFIMKGDIIQHPMLGRINQMPRLPPAKTHVDYVVHLSRVKELNQYVKHLLLLQPEICKRAPIPEFFGKWPKDVKMKDSLPTPPLNGTYDLDILVGNSPLSAGSSAVLPTPSIPVKNTKRAQDSTPKPTFEEFVNDLAKNLGVEMKEPRTSIDTVLESPQKNISIQSVATVLESHKLLKPAQSMDTGLVASHLKPIPVAKSMDNIRDTIIEENTKSKNSNCSRSQGRIDIAQDDLDGHTLTRFGKDEKNKPMLLRSNTLRSDSTVVNDAVDNLDSCRDRIGYQERLRLQKQRPNGSLRSNQNPKPQSRIKIDTNIPQTSGPASPSAVAIPSRKESRNWNSGDSPAPPKLTLLNSSARTPTTSIPIISSPLSERYPSLERDHYELPSRSNTISPQSDGTYPSLGRDRDTFVKESLSTLVRATKRRESPSREANRDTFIDQSLDAIRGGTTKRMLQSANEPTDPSIITLRIVLSHCQPLYIVMDRSLHFDDLIDQVSTLIAETPSSRKWRMLPPPRDHMVAVQNISYRTPDLGMSMIQNDHEWKTCKCHAKRVGKVTLFVTVHEHKLS
jgi:hypothetical protein